MRTPSVPAASVKGVDASSGTGPTVPALVKLNDSERVRPASGTRSLADDAASTDTPSVFVGCGVTEAVAGVGAVTS